MKELTEEEQEVLQNLKSELTITKRTTSGPVVIALVGLVGAGKSGVAREIAQHFTSTVIVKDDIRVALRKADIGYEHAGEIALELVHTVLAGNGNVVWDGDMVSKKNQQMLAKEIRKEISVHYVRVYAERDTMIKRIIEADYAPRPDGFFGSAAVKIREMWRRTPWHYEWSEEHGGVWNLRELDISFLTEIDTTDEQEWPLIIKDVVSKVYN